MPARKKTHLLTNGPLLNFHKADMSIPHPVTGGDALWLSVEHYFQACKGLFIKNVPANDREHAHFWAVENIRALRSPADAKRAGRALDIHLPLWNRASFAYMLTAHIAKFSQHPDLRAMLLETGSKRLIEHRPDPVWGDNMDGTGKNLCGRSLMIVRRMARDWSEQ